GFLSRGLIVRPGALAVELAAAQVLPHQIGDAAPDLKRPQINPLPPAQRVDLGPDCLGGPAAVTCGPGGAFLRGPPTGHGLGHAQYNAPGDRAQAPPSRQFFWCLGVSRLTHAPPRRPAPSPGEPSGNL